MPLSPHPILAQHFDSCEVAFAKIDQEVKILQESIRALRAFRNTFTPICRIPPEVLTRIFSFARRLPGHDLYFGKTKNLDWIFLTHVSQHWRNVALGCPSLWSHISSDYPKPVVKEWLRRSKAAPLTVKLHNIKNAAFVGESLSRIRELTVHISASSWDELASRLSSPAPLLEYLSVSTVRVNHRQPPSNISNNMFEGNVPRLRRLKLTDCSIDINSSLLADLTVLELCNPPQKLSVKDIIATLSRVSRLTSLKLSDVLEEGTPSVSSPLDVVTLPSLESIYVKGRSFIQDLDIVSHLSFPETSTLQFYSVTETGTDVAIAFANFLNVLKAARQQSSPSLQTSAPLSHLALECSWHKLTLDITVNSSEMGDTTDFLKLQLDATGLWPRHLAIPDTSEIASLLPTLPISTLSSFSTDCDIGVETWANVFGPLPSLYHISASGPLSVNILSAIINDFKALSEVVDRKHAEDQAKKSTKGKKKKGKGTRRGKGKKQAEVDSTPDSELVVDWDLIFPELGALDLHNATFPKSAEDLVKALQTRKSVDKGIKLGIYGCKISEEMIEALDEAVPSLMWDEETGTEADKGYDSEFDDPYGW
ncbi:hypothetical protein BDN72DRAFT_845535 [Pluteus cervinus]|uniref:Uncharacterized protein n=1 Tax=Pluteus cervinus TaxID=181527 RepID=A0ACD3AIJ4_9AGAR|nr:hypothetical protein BDN72DRAFT_845535 [Pluteus cervinus]